MSVAFIFRLKCEVTGSFCKALVDTWLRLRLPSSVSKSVSCHFIQSSLISLSSRLRA